MIKSLGYIGICSDKKDEWRDMAVRCLGMQEYDVSRRNISFRMDDRKQRLFISDKTDFQYGVTGWEVDGPDALNGLAARLEAANVKVTREPCYLAAERLVTELISFSDPGGNRLEAFFGAELAVEPFSPGRMISGFRTGALGMGHAVLTVKNIDVLLPFYRDVLEFGVTDYGLSPYKLFFFHVNERHHSFAMVESSTNGFHHFMVELTHIDDVGQGYDLFKQEENRIAYTLGRHTNDHMFSFYAKTPSNFFVEYGWGARTIDPASWKPHETFDGPSLWGHERLYMDETNRKQLRDMSLDAAARGVQAPLAVQCPWLNSVIRQE